MIFTIVGFTGCGTDGKYSWSNLEKYQHFDKNAFWRSYSVDTIMKDGKIMFTNLRTSYFFSGSKKKYLSSIITISILYIDPTTLLKLDLTKKKVEYRKNYSYRKATYSDQFLPWDPNREIHIKWKPNYVENGDGEKVDEQTLEKLALTVAEAFGRIPAYLRGEWNSFEIDTSKKFCIVSHILNFEQKS